MSARAFGDLVCLPNQKPRDRRRHDRVLRGSVDIFSPEATKRRPFSNGTRSDAQLKIEALVRVAEEHQAESIREGPKYYQGDLGHNGSKLLRAFLKHLNYRQNTCDSALSQIDNDTGVRRDAIMDGRDKLVAHGYLDYLRRSVATGNPKAFGFPQREQASNLTWPTPQRLPEKWRRRFAEIFAELKAEQAERARQIREVQGMSRQQRAERRQARRKAAMAAKPPRMCSGGQERSLAKLNPAAVGRARSNIAQAEADRWREEQETAERVRANLPELLAKMDGGVDPHASG